MSYHWFDMIAKHFTSLVWPIVLFVIVLLFKKEITDLLRRIKNFKYGGFEARIGGTIQKTEETAKKVEDAIKMEEKSIELAVKEVVLDPSDLEKTIEAAKNSLNLAMINLAEKRMGVTFYGMRPTVLAYNLHRDKIISPEELTLFNEATFLYGLLDIGKKRVDEIHAFLEFVNTLLRSLQSPDRPSHY
jgi:hypothetical protein